ncbi:S41 family peptidase [Pedobacter africanus]|uniref:Uncharacterized protein n=1 Tax=Pedobacter africanus TaxID=151894 RepID=A0ACC6L3B0_9SPHI|nr:S41 family peptidase [Pedobacter africanus]MDR6785982.1 hypothetical protein [Pedobacter africanus]
MKRKQRYLNYQGLFILLIPILLYSCKKENTDLTGDNDKSLTKIFIQFWDKMNYQYVFWDKDPTNWNAMYKQYKPLFNQLENTDEDKRKAVSYFREMTGDLIDNHFNITFRDEALLGSVVNPSLDRKRKNPNFHGKYSYDGVAKSYLDAGFLSTTGNINQDGIPINATVGTINNNLLYFRCNFFALKQSYESNNGNKIKMVLDHFFSQLKRTTTPIKGVILDLRNNSGGNIADLNFFVGKLINKDVTFGYTRSKNGLGKWGYLPWLEARLKHDAQYNVNVPIILLGDNYTASLAEIIVLALKSEKNLFIGEQTYGATGPLSDSDIFNAGSFNVGDFLTVKTSAVQFKGMDGKFYEGIGITPDLHSPFNSKNLSLGKDDQLELAISQIK